MVVPFFNKVENPNNKPPKIDTNPKIGEPYLPSTSLQQGLLKQKVD